MLGFGYSEGWTSRLNEWREESRSPSTYMITRLNSCWKNHQSVDDGRVSIAIDLAEKPLDWFSAGGHENGALLGIIALRLLRRQIVKSNNLPDYISQDWRQPWAECQWVVMNRWISAPTEQKIRLLIAELGRKSSYARLGATLRPSAARASIPQKCGHSARSHREKSPE